MPSTIIYSSSLSGLSFIIFRFQPYIKTALHTYIARVPCRGNAVVLFIACRPGENDQRHDRVLFFVLSCVSDRFGRFVLIFCFAAARGVDGNPGKSGAGFRLLPGEETAVPPWRAVGLNRDMNSGRFYPRSLVCLPSFLPTVM